MALTAQHFPRFTRVRLGLPQHSNLTNHINDVITAAGYEVELLLGGEYAKIAANPRFDWALTKLVEAMLWDEVAGHISDKVGTRKQGGASYTKGVDSVEAAQRAAIQARAEWNRRLGLLGGSRVGVYSVRTRRV